MATINFLEEIHDELSTLAQHNVNFDITKVKEIYGNLNAKWDSLDTFSLEKYGTPHDCLYLLSLCYLTVGNIYEPISLYCSIVTIKILLNNLNDYNIFTCYDLKPLRQRLNDIYAHILDSEDRTPIQKFILNELKSCLQTYELIGHKLNSIDKHLNSILVELMQVRKDLVFLAFANMKSFLPNCFVLKQPIHKITQDSYNEKLAKINNKIKLLEKQVDDNGNFTSLEDNKVYKSGQTILNGMLANCKNLYGDLNPMEFGSKLQKIFERSLFLKINLETILVTGRTTLKETDLFKFHKELMEIDNELSKINENNNFKGKTIILFILRRSHAVLNKLLESSEPVSQNLKPIYNQLSTLCRYLFTMKRMGGVEKLDDLKPIELKLNNLLNGRVNNKFQDSDGNIPEGQGSLNALLQECFELLRLLKIDFDGRVRDSDQVESMSKDVGKFLVISDEEKFGKGQR